MCVCWLPTTAGTKKNNQIFFTFCVVCVLRERSGRFFTRKKEEDSGSGEIFQYPNKEVKRVGDERALRIDRQPVLLLLPPTLKSTTQYIYIYIFIYVSDQTPANPPPSFGAYIKESKRLGRARVLGHRSARQQQKKKRESPPQRRGGTVLNTIEFAKRKKQKRKKERIRKGYKEYFLWCCC